MSGQSGSEERQTPRNVAFRLDDDEVRTVEAICVPGESPGQLARRLLMAHVGRELKLTPRRRQRRRRPGDDVLARILGQFGKIGENINRLGHAASAGRAIDQAAIRTMRDALEEMRAITKAALGDG